MSYYHDRPHRRGDALSAQRLNQIADAARIGSSGLPRDGIVSNIFGMLTRRPGPDPASTYYWLGVVRTPSGDYTDERYIVRKGYVSNASGTISGELEITEYASGTAMFLSATATNLAERAGSTHNLTSGTPVLVLEEKDRQAVTRRFFERTPTLTLTGSFPVKVWCIGGTTNGDASHQCDRTYTARTLSATGPGTGGVLLGAALTPKTRRPVYGKLDTPPATGSGTIGLGYLNLSGTFCLFDANEALAVHSGIAEE